MKHPPLPRMMVRARAMFGLGALVAWLAVADGAARGQYDARLIEPELLAESTATLAADARSSGDAARGAILFHRAQMLCAKCHVAGTATTLDGAPPLGPDLARFDTRPADEYLVDAVLRPSKALRRGYETLSLVTSDGRSITGLLVEETPEAIALRDAAQEGLSISVPKTEIDERLTSELSIMPAGLVNLLASRQEFLDLVRYLIDIAEQGPERAAALRPEPASLAGPPQPEYESHLDHAALVKGLDKPAFKRGQAIYSRLCVNCHGTRDVAGSLPTSLRFASGRFRNGCDPLSMYRTLTHGFGMMTPQAWMVPRQKYDVIHYIREAFLAPYNPSQYTPIDASYLASLPKGDTLGPMPAVIEPWAEMDYGPFLMETYEIGRDGSNIAYKGIAIRLDAGSGGVARGRCWIVYEHDTLRAAAAWSGERFIDYQGISFDGRHNAHPHVVGRVHFSNPTAPGWANPATGGFEDTRLLGRDSRRYGPLPRVWGHYQGLDDDGERITLRYSVGEADIRETPSLEPIGDEPRGGANDATPSADRAAEPVVIARTLEIGPAAHELVMRVAPVAANVALVGGGEASLAERDGFHVLIIPARQRAELLKILITDADKDVLRRVAARAQIVGWSAPADDSAPPLRAPRWADTLETRPAIGHSDASFAVDVLAHPVINPWACQMRLTGFDFVDADTAAVCTWDGDVWLVRGVDRLDQGLSWQRIASGLFQPLGLKVVGGRVHLTCRDQLVILNDTNGDGVCDRYENFNSDHQVTEHFHEFAMGLEIDADGDFYYAKSARHALPALVPHHGTLLRISRDGTKTDILATGFRAANGVCLNDDGSFIVTDQEGHWNPKNRVNWVEEGGFYGNMFGYHDVTDPSDAAMRQPLCWITNEFDRSPAQLLWVPKGRWGALSGSLLNLSYGYGKVYVVPHEKVDGQMQGGMCELPITQFPTGTMRGRFHPTNGHLYLCGMFCWAGSQTQPGGFYRVRATGQPMRVPVELHATRDGLTIGFSDELDPASAGDPSNFAIRVWSLRRTAKYGSDHHDERSLAVAAAKLAGDRRTLRLTIPDIAPTWCMEIKYQLRSADGQDFSGVIHNTIHHLAESSGAPARAPTD